MSRARVDRKRPCPVTRSYHCFACAVQELGLEVARRLPIFSKARAQLRLVTKEYPMKPTMKPVESSTISAIAYDATDRSLYVEFKSGGTYRYDGVGPELFTEFEAAESQGKFLAARIKGKFTFERLPAAGVKS